MHTHARPAFHASIGGRCVGFGKEPLDRLERPAGSVVPPQGLNACQFRVTAKDSRPHVPACQRRNHTPQRSHAASKTIRHRRVARLALRRARHAHLHAGGHALRGRFADARWRRRRAEGCGYQGLDHPGGLSRRLGARWRFLRPSRRCAGPEPHAGSHDFVLRGLHRALGAVHGLDASAGLPLPFSPRHRR